MKKILTIALVLCAGVVCAEEVVTSPVSKFATTSSRAAEREAPNDSRLKGQWTGVLSGTGSTSEHRTLAIRLTLDDAKAKVEFQKKNGVWKETMPGLFRVSIDRCNAVVQGTNSGKSDEDVWVETWVFGITSQSENTLRVAYSRVVNNVTSPSSDENKTFAYGLSGTFTRRTAEILAAEESSQIVEITAEESGTFHWRGKSMSAEGLKAALIAESKLRPITEVRLLEGNTYPDWKQLINYGDAVRAIGLKQSFFERDGEFKTINWVD